MSKYKPYRGYALFITYQDDDQRLCRAEIFANSSLVEASEWENTEEKAFSGAFQIIDNWYKQRDKQVK